MAIIQTPLGPVDLGPDLNLASGAFGNIDELLRARVPQGLDLIRGGTEEALRLTQLGREQAISPLEPFTGLEAGQEQQALLGLLGEEAQQAAIAGIPQSQAQAEANRRQTETLLRGFSATGDIGSGAALLQAGQLGAQQQGQSIFGRLSELEPLAGTSRSVRGTLADIERSSRLREANLQLGQGSQLANIRFGAAATGIESIQAGAEQAGLASIGRFNQQQALQTQLAQLGGQFFNRGGGDFSGGGQFGGFNQAALSPNIFGGFQPQQQAPLAFTQQPVQTSQFNFGSFGGFG